MTTTQTVSLITNGCSEAIKYTNILRRFFLRNSYEVTENYSVSGLIIFYACGLTEKSRQNSIELIRSFIKNKQSDTRLIVWGCLPKVDPNLIHDFGQGTIIGPLDIGYFDNIIERPHIPVSCIEESFSSHILWEDRLLSGNRAHEDLFSRSIQYDHFINDYILALARLILLNPFLNKSLTRLFEAVVKSNLAAMLIKANHARSHGTLFIPIATGCNNHCTYCAEKQIYGGIKSREEKVILDEFENGLHNGYLHFSLIATDLSAYGKDNDSSLANVLGRILEIGAQQPFQIFLHQAEPSTFFASFKELKPLMRSDKIVGLNCPVQSGSNRLLKVMGRHYDAGEWREKMLEVNKINKKIRLTTHLLVGFPTETDDDLEMTAKLFEYPLVVKGIRVFKYNENPRLPASRICGKVPEEIKTRNSLKMERRFATSFIRNILIKR